MVSQCIKIWNRVFLALCDKFRLREIFFSNFFFKFLAHPRPTGITIPPTDKFYAAREILRPLPAVRLRLPSAVTPLYFSPQVV